MVLDVRATVVLAALVALGLAPATPASPHGGTITGIVGESGEVGPSPRFVVMAADGRNAQVRLGWVYAAELSPNGRLVAYDQVGAALVHGSYERQIWLGPAEANGKSRRLV